MLATRMLGVLIATLTSVSTALAQSCAPSAPPSLPPPAIPEEGGRQPPEFYSWIVLLLLNVLSGTFSGLNLGLMSLTVEDLNIIIEGSTDPDEVRYARRILPLRKRGNLLLCTLLVGNTLVNVMLAIMTDPIWTWMFGDGTLGFVFSLLVPTALIVVFGEIIPQAYCGRNSLFIGALSVPLVWAFVVLTYPLTKPISMLLDRVLGREISNVLSRQMLLELVTLNVDSKDHAAKSGLTQEDGRLLKGALTFKDRVVGDVMTPLDKCFLMSEDARLDGAVFMDILSHGHTRIPVYKDTRENVIAVLFCKDLLGIGFERETPLGEVLASFKGDARDVRVPRSMKLNVAMDTCKQRRTHLLLVCEEEDGWSGEPDAEGRLPVMRDDAPVVGVVTMEDFIEELIQDEIVDETDAWFYERQQAVGDTPEPTGAGTGAGGARAATPLQKSKSRAAPVKKVAVRATREVDLTAHLRKLTAVGGALPGHDAMAA
jgi:metal transporter CNNM